MSLAAPPARAAGALDKQEQELVRAWASPGGWRSVTAVNHRPMGKRFVATALLFFLIAGVLALLIRAQLAVPGNDLLGPAAYNQIFTMHGTMMLFLFAVPVLQGAATFLLPLMLGARDLPFPRLGAFSYWCFLMGGLILVSSLLLGLAPDAGWFIYPPLSGSHWSPGTNTDFWLIGITFAEIAGIAGAIEIVVSILRTRAPGMTLARMPLFAWYMLVTAGMILAGFPPLILGSILFELERAFGWPFFDAARGGDPVLWQHLFWLFGHPEVYIILLPAVGLLAMLVPVHAKAPAFGHNWLVAAALGTGFLSMGLWVHHMYAVGIPQMSLAFFAAASTLVAIPSGIQVFALIGTIGQGRPVFRTPLLFACGFVFIFVLGGLTGVMVALVPFDLVAHDTQFVVAHLHYVLIGGSVFPLLGALHHWWPVATGRAASERVGKISFWLLFLGFNLNFFPLHHTGLAGMPRRVYTYPEGLGWEWSNGLASAGAALFALGVVLFLGNLVLSLLRRDEPADNPFEAGTLEWWRTPPPVYNFRAIPAVDDRHPLWADRELAAAIGKGQGYLADPQGERRLTLVTTEVEARPEMALQLPGPTWIPVATAACFAALFLGVLTQLYAVAVAGAVAAFVACLVWMWPEPDARYPLFAHLAPGDRGVPTERGHHRGPAWTALWVTLGADAALFASLVFSFFFLWGYAANWPAELTLLMPLAVPTAALLPLALGTAAAWWAEAAIRRGDRAALARRMLLAILAGVAFLSLQLWIHLVELPPADRHARHALGHFAAFYQGIHLVIALAMAAMVALRARRGDFAPDRHAAVRIAVRFWSFAALVWLVSFPLVHLSPWLFLR